MKAVTVKERLHRVIAEMSDDQAAEMLALAEGVKAGATPVDIYGTAWGQVLDGMDPEVLVASSKPSIKIPRGIPDIE